MLSSRLQTQQGKLTITSNKKEKFTLLNPFLHSVALQQQTVYCLLPLRRSRFSLRHPVMMFHTGRQGFLLFRDINAPLHEVRQFYKLWPKYKSVSLQLCQVLGAFIF